ncbi:hypothetical protein FHU29_001024 [Hoyosella altamirensis]|uniref:Uncharacterized protein n=1 Tax=Hoyosella altamirensis TaxID=616997 RepID=A0A839RJG0_9ACTN|nr:hypothetical protein [Hoyosella altamirensis]
MSESESSRTVQFKGAGEVLVTAAEGAKVRLLTKTLERHSAHRNPQLRCPQSWGTSFRDRLLRSFV